MKQAWALALALLCAAAGCSKAKPDSFEPRESKPALQVFALGDEDSNGGYALQVVVRAVEEPDFMEDSYSDIAGLVSRPDETVLAVLTVFPGEVTTKTITLEELPPMVGVYGMFNETAGGEWKLLLSPRPASELGLVNGAQVIEFATTARSVRDIEDSSP